MSRRFAHLSKKELEKIRDTPLLHSVQSSRSADSTHETTAHTLKNNASVDQVEAVAELDERRMRRSVHFTLIVSFLILVFAAIAAWPVIREWIQSPPPSSATVVSQPSQSHSIPQKPTEVKKSISQ
jgi:cytoskeletal protein RodZ